MCTAPDVSMSFLILSATSSREHCQENHKLKLEILLLLADTRTYQCEGEGLGESCHCYVDSQLVCQFVERELKQRNQ